MYKICESCNSEFETVINSQTECGSCLVRPGNARSRTYAKKICIDCETEFIPSGPRTLRCPNCNDRKNDTWEDISKDYTPGCLTADMPESTTKPPNEDEMTENTTKIKRPLNAVKDSSIGSLCQGVLSLTGADEITMVINDLEISISKIKTEEDQ